MMRTSNAIRAGDAGGLDREGSPVRRFARLANPGVPMNTPVLALVFLAVTSCGGPGDAPPALSSQGGTEKLDGTGITPPACEDIHFVSECLPADCFARHHTQTSESLTRHALCPTLHGCKSFVDIVSKTRTCTADGCGNVPHGFLRCYEPDGDDD